MRRTIPLIALLVVGCQPDFGETKADTAATEAMYLQNLAKTHAVRNDDMKLESLDVLAQYSVDGEKALTDPWGQKFQFKYVVEPETQDERLVIWTVEPKTGKVIAAPRQLAHLVGPSN